DASTADGRTGNAGRSNPSSAQRKIFYYSRSRQTSGSIWRRAERAPPVRRTRLSEHALPGLAGKLAQHLHFTRRRNEQPFYLILARRHLLLRQARGVLALQFVEHRPAAGHDPVPKLGNDAGKVGREFLAGDPLHLSRRHGKHPLAVASRNA